MTFDFYDTLHPLVLVGEDMSLYDTLHTLVLVSEDISLEGNKLFVVGTVIKH